MITERKYRNALLIVKRYQEEQDQIKFSRMSCANITSDTLIKDLYYASIITPRLYNILKRHYYEKIGELAEVNVDEFRRWRNVGERTINEFIKLKEYE
jgi:DNA-directed RNA polymerase alpha subunit